MDLICVICREEFSKVSSNDENDSFCDEFANNQANNNQEVIITPCRHLFHKNCISNWLEISSTHSPENQILEHEHDHCPLCQASMHLTACLTLCIPNVTSRVSSSENIGNGTEIGKTETDVKEAITKLQKELSALHEQHVELLLENLMKEIDSIVESASSSSTTASDL